MAEYGIVTVEVGEHGYLGKARCNPAEILADDGKDSVAAGHKTKNA